jgi:hypothetical protein
MNENFKPDYGLFCLKCFGKDVNHTLYDYELFCIDWIDENIYSSTSNMEHGDETYCITLDFSKKMYNILLTKLPEKLSSYLKEKFKGNFEKIVKVTLDKPVKVGLSVKLGKLIKNDYDEYIPFNVIEIF